MFEILGKKFITDKEASGRYGYSQSWFIRARYEGKGPKFLQIEKSSRVLYPLDETDDWFREKMKGLE